jgi:class I fructose-bisphosphate aldolase
MNIGKRIRLSRLFSHPSGRLFSVAVDHFGAYPQGLPPSLQQMQETLSLVVEGRPDAVTMQIGVAMNAWAPHAAKVPLILQSTFARPDDSHYELLASPEDAVRVGADAFAIATYVRGPTEGKYLRLLSDQVRIAARFEMPVICHIYPRTILESGAVISFLPEDIAWAVHCAFECGADVIKVPYCANVDAYRQIVGSCPLPVVAAGGPKQDTLPLALGMMYDVVQSGARGATVGRNVWGFARIPDSIAAFKSVIHDGATPKEALAKAGFPPP